MSIDGVHHITLRCQDVAASQRFYASVIGLTTDEVTVGSGADSVLFRAHAGDTLILLRPPLPGTAPDEPFSEYRIGMDHLALRVSERSDLDRLVERLTAAGVPTKGVHRHPWRPAEFVCFRDPDNIQVEFYCERAD